MYTCIRTNTHALTHANAHTHEHPTLKQRSVLPFTLVKSCNMIMPHSSLPSHSFAPTTRLPDTQSHFLILPAYPFLWSFILPPPVSLSPLPLSHPS